MNTGLGNGDRFLFALGQSAGVPIAYLALIERRGRVWNIAHIGKGYGRPGLDADTRRPITVFYMPISGLPLVRSRI